MRIPFWIKRDTLYRKNYIRSELNKLTLKVLIRKKNAKLLHRIHWTKLYHKYGKKHSLALQRRGCQLSGTGRSVFKQFKASRHRVKHLAVNGFLTGIRKSSF